MSSLQRLYEGRVGAEEIDHIGHMNVRFYAARAAIGTRKLLEELGLEPAPPGQATFIMDTYTRHLREQMQGNPLYLEGGIVRGSQDGLQFYHELYNADSGVRAATFIHRVRLIDLSTLEAVTIPAAVVERANRTTVRVPEHGQPRSINIEHVRADLTLQDLESRGLPRRETRRIEADECNAEGVYLPGQGRFLHWANQGDMKKMLELLKDAARMKGQLGPRRYGEESGRRISAVTLESRTIMLSLPRVGDEIQTYDAATLIAGKISQRNIWAFDRASGRLRSIHSMVDIAFDLDLRKPVDMPPEMLADLQANYQPDLI